MKLRASLRSAVFSSLLILSGSSLAQNAGRVGADLSDQFPPTVSVEKGGGTCTLYASADLVGAACYRRIGKHVDFSKRALYVQYLHALLQEPYQGHDLLPKPDTGELTDLEGGLHSSWALGDLTSGEDCYTESTAPLDPDFTAHIKRIIESYGEEEAQMLSDAKAAGKNSGSLDRIRADEWAAADTELQFEFGAFLTNPGSNPDIAACLSARPAMKVIDLSVGSNIPGRRVPPGFPVSLKVVDRELEEHSLPVLCEANVTYQLADGSTVTGDHAFLIVGVRSSGDGKKEFLLRDPNNPNPIWDSKMNGDCEHAWVVR